MNPYYTKNTSPNRIVTHNKDNMCFYNSMSAKARKLAERYNLETDVVKIAEQILTEQYRVTAFTNPDYPIISHIQELESMKWGLIPHWVKAKGDSDKAKEAAAEKAFNIRKGTYNARSETLFELPSYRGPIRYNRCIIPSTGYFEYHHNPDGTTTPYFIYLKGEEIFSMGGIYDSWTNPDNGEEFRTFSMITTEANELTAQIHNGGKNPFRMPLILRKADEEKWLDPDLSKEDIENLLKPYPAELMAAYKIGSDFRKKAPGDKTIIEPEE